MRAPFLWGAATSAHQVEGNNVHSDWWAWEQATAGVERSGRAADHWHRYKEDLALAKKLGHNAHRFSIEWSRIEPRRGQFNKAAIKHYREVLEELKSLGMVSFVTLHHFTNPRWLAEQGGWERGEVVDLFGRYVNYVGQHLGELVDFWVTINEPMVYANEAYLKGKWPPQKRSYRRTAKVVRHLVGAHKRAYRILHKLQPEAKVGIAKHYIAQRIHLGVRDWTFNHMFYYLTRGAHDYMGVNYYFSSHWDKWTGPRTDLGWPIDPAGLTQVLLHVKQAGLPIYITENGLADSEDKQRADFIRGHIKAIEEAQAQGADVRGYLHWSLLDNFEWAAGFKPRFGLVEVDYKTMARRVRSSAYVYKAIIERRDL